MVAMWLLVLLALLGLGGVAIVVTGIAIAAARNRPGLAVLAAALGLGALLIGGLTAAMFVGYGSRAEIVSSEFNIGPVHWQFDGPVDGPYESRSSWFAAGLKILLIGGAVLAFVMVIARQLRSETCMGKHRIGWTPAAILMLATLGMLGVLGLRWLGAPGHHRQQAAYHHAQEAARSAQQMADEAQRRVASMQAEIAHGTAQMSIEALEDKYTSPRIPLPPPVAPTPPSIASVSPTAAAIAVEVVEAAGPAPAASEADPAEEQKEDATDPSTEDTSISETAVEQSEVETTSIDDDVSGSDESLGDEVNDDPAEEAAEEVHADVEEAPTEESQADDSSDRPNAEDPAVEASVDVEEPTAASTISQSEQEVQGSARISYDQRADTDHAASVAIKEMTAGLASFANAMNQVIDKYAERAAAEASAQEKLKVVAAEIAATSKPPRPNWLEEGPKKIGNVQRDIIATDEYVTEQECYRARDIYLLLATYEHLARLVGLQNYEDYAENSRPNLTFHDNNYILADGEVIVSDGRPENHRLQLLESMGIGVDYVRREIGKEEHFETVDRSVGPMKKLYTLVEFNDSVDRELQHRWEANRRQERFTAVGLGSGSILGVLGLMWGLLKVDTATKGYYTKRLLLGVPLGILGALGIFLLLVVLQSPS